MTAIPRISVIAMIEMNSFTLVPFFKIHGRLRLPLILER